MDVGQGLVKIALTTGLFTAGAVVLGSPIGAAGGAIYGATFGVIRQVFVGELPESIDWRTHKVAHITFQLLAGVTCFLGAWKLVTLFGVNMTLKSAFILTLTSAGIGLGVVATIGLIALAAGLVAKKAPVN